MSGSVSYQVQQRVHPITVVQIFSPTHTNVSVTIASGGVAVSTSANNIFVKAFAANSYSSGLFNFEITVNFANTTRVGIGNTNSSTSNNLGASLDEIGWDSSGTVFNNGSAIATWQSYTTGQTVRFAFDLNNNRVWGRVGAGPWNNSGTANPSTNIGGIPIPSTVTAFPVVPGIVLFALSDHHVAAFSVAAWTYIPPIGFGSTDLVAVSAWANIGSSVTTPLSETITGLLPNTNYDFQVVASNHFGQTVSPTLNIITPQAGAPGAISLLSATPNGYTNLNYLFNVVMSADTLGAAPVTYNVFAATSPNGPFQNVSQFTTPSGSVNMPINIPTTVQPVLTGGAGGSGEAPITNPSTFFDDFTGTSISLYSTRNVSAGGTWQPALWYVSDGNVQGGGYTINPFDPNTPETGVYTIVSSSIAGLSIRTPQSQTTVNTIGSTQYVQGIITTEQTFRQLYGYFEIRCSTPLLQGGGSAFWLTANADPPEIDIFEIVSPQGNTGNGNVTPWIVHMDVHNLDNSTQDWYSYQNNTYTNFNVSAYHTYGCNWQSDFITFYIDRVQTFQVANPGGVYKTTPMFIIVEYTAGANVVSDWVGPITNPALLPATMGIDYVQVWKTRPF
jgi:beta-glucanase (GH16 family)